MVNIADVARAADVSTSTVSYVLSGKRTISEQTRQRVTDWYTGGVVVTCRWVATAIVRPAAGPWRPARSPVTGRSNQAYEELIEAEYLAAEVLAMRRPVPAWLAERPGWIEAILATLDWCWRGSKHPPMELRHDRTG